MDGAVGAPGLHASPQPCSLVRPGGNRTVAEQPATMARAPGCATGISVTSTAGPRLNAGAAKVFGDNMILQQELPIAVWGWADAGEQVTVQLAAKEDRRQGHHRGLVAAGQAAQVRPLRVALLCQAQPAELRGSPRRAVQDRRTGPIIKSQDPLSIPGTSRSLARLMARRRIVCAMS